MHWLAEYSFRRPFLDIPPVWDYWLWLLIPLCIGVAIVHKSIKCATMKRVPWEALVITAWILLGMAAAAGTLAGVVRFLER